MLQFLVDPLVEPNASWQEVNSSIYGETDADEQSAATARHLIENGACY